MFWKSLAPVLVPPKVIALLLAPAAEKVPLNTNGTVVPLLLILPPMVLLARAIARLMFPVGATVPVKVKIPSVLVFPMVMVLPMPMALTIPLGSMLVALSVPCWMAREVKLFRSFESKSVATPVFMIPALFVPLVSLTSPEIVKPWLVAVVMVRAAVRSKLKADRVNQRAGRHRRRGDRGHRG